MDRPDRPVMVNLAMGLSMLRYTLTSSTTTVPRDPTDQGSCTRWRTPNPASGPDRSRVVHEVEDTYPRLGTRPAKGRARTR